MRETYRIFKTIKKIMKMVCMWVLTTLLFSLEHKHVNWLRYYTSIALCGFKMNINGILKSLFWISLHQGMLSILCSRIQGCMLFLINEVDLWSLHPLCVLYEMQNKIFQQRKPWWLHFHYNLNSLSYNEPK